MTLNQRRFNIYSTLRALWVGFVDAVLTTSLNTRETAEVFLTPLLVHLHLLLGGNGKYSRTSIARTPLEP